MAEPTQLASADPQRGQYQAFVDRITTQVIAAMPLTVPDGDLKRARARFRVAFSADAQAALQKCSPESVARAIVLSAMSGLFPGGPRPDVWLIPRKNKHTQQLEANWQMSFRGYIRLGRRAGWELQPVLVFEGEKFEIQEGDKPSVTHTRNLDLPQTWETLRYGYIRVFPVGNRDEMNIAYLSKAEIQKRRAKAQDDSIWREWPLEMSKKTLCQYAGNRELFPTDDPARHALEASDQAEIGAGGSNAEMWGSLPSGTKTANLAARLNGKTDASPVAIEVEGRPLETVDAGASFDPGESEEAEVSSATLEPPAHLSASQIAELRKLAAGSGVSFDLLEERFGGPLADFEKPGASAADIEALVHREIKKLAKK